MLIAAISTRLPPQGVIFLSLFLILWGLYCLIAPRSATLFGKRWQYRGDVEPSDAAVFMTRIGGMIIILVGIGGIYASLFVGR